MKKFTVYLARPIGNQPSRLDLKAHGLKVADDSRAVYLLDSDGEVCAEVVIAHGVKRVFEHVPATTKTIFPS